ncbi:MAG TPA: L,D-transpeptidase family protein [Chthoniobacterales bacterium]|nr:L,D-transpeptidase family protein [Chthoniobacterales bacterium]
MHSRILIVLLALAAVAAKPVAKKAEAEGDRPSPKPKASVAPAIPVALPNYDEETSVKLQIFLDNNYFGPGKIDGRMGEFFRKALVHYKRAHGMAETGAVDSWLIDQVPETYTDYTIPEEALSFVGETKSKPSEQSKLKRMHYGSLLELVAERYHSAEEFLKKLNPGMNLEELKPGDTVKVPNVLPFKIEDLKPGFAEKNPAFANRKIYIDTKDRFLLIYDGKQLVAEFPITPGSAKLPAPMGLWKILGIATLPVFRHDEGVLNHGEKSGTFFNLPPGPNNPVGVLWMGLNKPHVGIHGTNNPETIGRASSHGCIRTANWDAARVRELVTVGNAVSIFR